MSEPSGDAELQAIQQLISALEPLDRDARTRVLEYVFGRLGIGPRPRGHDLSSLVTSPSPGEAATAMPSTSTGALPDIRSLTEEKAPKSATEMAAVVAYYLSELAPLQDRKKEIASSDVTKLFKQANFPLPGSPKMTLINAKNAGYLDPGSSRGSYILKSQSHF